jgi:hypothetical protein
VIAHRFVGSGSVHWIRSPDGERSHAPVQPKALVASPIATAHGAFVRRRDSTQEPMKERFERHRQPWTPSEIAKLHQLAGKAWSLRDIATALKRSEESVKIRAKLDKLTIASKH